MKDSLRVILMLALFAYLIQTYYIIQVCRAELECYEEDRNREWTDFFTESSQ